jgi:glycosyltransferase XagB
MQAAVARLALPPQFEIIVVPAGRPQTKPRALCYALPFCRGDLLTIYDAEDIPEPDQLEKAARAFANAGPELACLQAQLTFFNPNENWLTRQFTAEYAMLFGRLLPALADHRLPLPLGGTSNHFRTAALRAVGAWDPFNVTEDADLGLRLSRHGYETGTLDSLTYEEANTRLPNWMRQRARWLKGFLATWLVHMRDPIRLMRELGPAGFWIAQAMTIGVFASALLHPICLAATIVLAMAYPGLPEQAGLVLVAIAGLNLLVFVAGYGLAIYLTRDALRRRGIFGWRGTLATMPVYWLLASGAAWLALWQFMVAPFHWNKTVHGLSSFQGARRTSGLHRLMTAFRRGRGSVPPRVMARTQRPEA